MPRNGDHPSDQPPEYPMGIPPSEEVTVPELQAGSWEELARQLANRLLEDQSWKKAVAEDIRILKAQVALIPKRGEQ